MRKNWIIAAVIAGALVLPVVAGAHGGHTHKVMGTVASVDGTHVVVTTTDGKTMIVMLDTKTAVTRGKTKLDAAAVKVGERVVVEGTEQNKTVTAKTIKLGETPAATAKK